MFWQSRNDSKWFKIYVFEKRIMADEPPHLMAKVSDFSIFLVPPYSDEVKIIYSCQKCTEPAIRRQSTKMSKMSKKCPKAKTKLRAGRLKKKCREFKLVLILCRSQHPTNSNQPWNLHHQICLNISKSYDEQ